MQSTPSRASERSGMIDVLAIGFGTTVAMWGIGYVGHMPLTNLPTALFVSLMLVCLVVGGWVAGRTTSRGVSGGIWIGLVAATLNLLILGSTLTHPSTGQLVPHAALWIPGWFALATILAAFGALLSGKRGQIYLLDKATANRASTKGKKSRKKKGARRPSDMATDSTASPNWAAVFAWIACAAAMLLITAGGLVTGFRAGMAVPDWPNTAGSNMFLYPLAKMTGGVFYEHAHRLLGTLLGLATFVLAVYLTRTMRDRKRLLKFVWVVAACVLLQGIFGGLRVTDDSHCLAVVHGFFAHAILAGLVAVAVMLSYAWRATGIENRSGSQPCGPSANTDRFLTALTVGLVLLQTLLGTFVRQLNLTLLAHIAFAALVVLAVVGTGVRAWGLNPRRAVPRRCGIVLLLLILLQINLGIVAVMFRTPPVGQSPMSDVFEIRTDWVPISPLPALATTAHQATAALVLATTMVLAVWTWRPAQEPAELQTACRSPEPLARSA